MNIRILHSWLREYLDTNAKPAEIAKSLSLCGPSVERLEKVGQDYSYDIEITSNRVDSASVIGIAREAAVILPQFGYKAKFKEPKIVKIKPSKLKPLFSIQIDKNIKRVMAAVMENVHFAQTPEYIRQRLIIAGMRPINSMVDITNYVMLETGHPTHVFDYDLIKNNKFLFRQSKKGEKVTSFDGKTYTLPGDDIVIENGKGEIIDLPGIIGTKNSVVNKNTKNILFFIDNNDPVKIRKTSMNLGIRTMAAVLNEKGVDPELASLAFEKGIQLYQKICAAKKPVFTTDIYPSPYRQKNITVNHEFIEQRLGIVIPQKRVVSILETLGFKVKTAKETYTIGIPSYRSNDVEIPEDIVEEVARIYGYHNLPSKIMTGVIPLDPFTKGFKFEKDLKYILKSLGGTETYTLSLVPKEYVTGNSLRLKNPLGSDSEYLRTSLMPSLIQAVKNNSGETDPFFLFEMANSYIPKKGALPQEKLILAAIFSNYEYRDAKGVIESLLNQLNIEPVFEIEEKEGFAPGSRVTINSKSKSIAELGIITGGNYIYFETEVEILKSVSSETPKFVPIPKYPAQIEDITLTVPPKTSIGQLMEKINSVSKDIENIELRDIYKDSYTFRVWYQNKNKTLDNREVEKIREKVLSVLKTKFGAALK